MPIQIQELFAAAALVALASCGSRGDDGTSGTVAAEEKVLHVYNWADYIGQDTIAGFEQRTGIRVIYDSFDSSEVLETKMLTGRSGYDVVVPGSINLERQIRAGVYRKLDKSRLPNLSNLDPEILQRIAVSDSGNDHAIPYMWGTIGIGYNPAKVKLALGTDTIDSWSAVFDPAIASKLAKCGVALLDAPEEVIKSVLIYLGCNPNSERAENLVEAEQVLQSVRPFVRYFDTVRQIDDLASGEICAALNWNGYILQARKRGTSAASPVDVAYAHPMEGSLIWFDTLAIPADAPHPNNAHAFLDYLMEPEVIAAVSNEIGFANGNASSRVFIDEALRNDPSVYPGEDIMRDLHPFGFHTQKYIRDLNRAWTRIKTGQ